MTPTVTETGWTLRDLIADAIENVERPHVQDIAAIVARKLDEEQLRKFAMKGLDYEVRKFLADHRRTDSRTDADYDEAVG